ncbi:acyltransferase [Methanosphaera sp.]
MKIIKEDENNNKIIGYEPTLKDSTIKFHGKNNILICEENVRLVNSRIQFKKDNSIIYLASNKYNYQLVVDIYNNSVLFMDKNSSMNGVIHFILSEEKNIFVGKDCLFSFGIWFRLADPHLIYDANSMNRINWSRSIYVGDHVWFGQKAMILKGTHIGSGSIVGAESVVSNKKIPSNTVWAGNPARQVRSNVFYDRQSVNSYVTKDTKKSKIFDSSKWIYSDGEQLNVNDIDKSLKSKNMDEKIEFLVQLSNNEEHDRFYVEVIDDESLVTYEKFNKTQILLVIIIILLLLCFILGLLILF